MDDKSFYVLLASNSSPQLYNNNTLARFKNELPTDVNFTLEGWQVGLQSLAVNMDRSNVPYKLINNVNSMLYWQNMDIDVQPHSVFKFTNQHYESAAMFVNDVRKQMLESPISYNFVIQTARQKISFQLNSTVCLALHVDLCTWLRIEPPSEPLLYEWNGQQYNLFKGVNIAAKRSRFFNPPPKYIQVRLNEMKPNLSGSGYHHTLAYVPYKESSDVGMYHEVVRKEYFALDATNLSTLSVDLRDENGELLNLLPGQPTFIKLKFTKMNYVSFMLRLKSDSCADIYPGNTNTDFYSVLPNPIDLNNTWETALTSVQFPRTFIPWTTIEKGALWLAVKTPDKEWIQIALPENAIRDGSRLLTFINLELKNKLGSREILRMKITRGKAIFTSSEPISVKFSNLLGYVLGATLHVEGEYKPINLTAERKTIGLMQSIDCTRLRPHSFLIYCDIVRPSIIGNTYAKVLKLVPVPKEDKQQYFTFYECQHLDWVTLESNKLSLIQIQLRHTSGELIQFEMGGGNVLINLVFRQKKR